MPLGKLGLYPLDENGHAHALQKKCERYENDRYIAFADENHRVLSSPTSQLNSAVRCIPATAFQLPDNP